jgi:hypothetical protein
MAQTSWPWEGVNTSETQFSRWAKHIGGGQGVVGIVGDNNLKIVADSSGMRVTAKAASGASLAIVRGHMFSSTQDELVTIAAAEANPRIDRVVLTLDPSLNSIVLAVVKGVAGVSPVAPSLTQTETGIYMMELAKVSVDAGTTTLAASSVSDLRAFLGRSAISVSESAPESPSINDLWFF